MSSFTAAQKATINARADLVLSTHAYDDVQSGGKGKRQVVKGMLERWMKAENGIITHSVGQSWKYYHKQCLTKTGEYTARALAGRDPTVNQLNFKHFPTHETHLQILDSEGNIIAYRFRIPEAHIVALRESAQCLPHYRKGLALEEEMAQAESTTSKGKGRAKGTVDQKRGGDILARNYGVYKSYVPIPRLKTDLLDDMSLGVKEWLNHNKDLWAYLGDRGLRNINPQMYGMFRNLNQFLPKGIEPVASPWLSVAANVWQYGPGNPHVDANDMGFGYNVVVGWDDKDKPWTSDLLLWQVKLRIEVVPGDAIFFLGRIFTHNAVVTSGGPRHVVDLYSHATVLNYCRGIKARGGGRENQSTNVKNWEKGSQRFDEPDTSYHPDREIEVEIEAEEALQNELRAMFSSNV